MQIATRIRNGLHVIADRTHAEPESTTLAFLCSDVVSFSRLTEEIGDRRSLVRMHGIERLVRLECAGHGGRELEMRGDCFLLAFAAPLDALGCGVAIHRALAADRHAAPKEQVALRTAIHVGCVVRNGESYFGRNLILAFRLLERAGCGEILISSQVRELVEEHWRGRLSEAHDFQPKGLRDPLRFVSVDWLDPNAEPRRVVRAGTQALARLVHEPGALHALGLHRVARDTSRLASSQP